MKMLALLVTAVVFAGACTQAPAPTPAPAAVVAEVATPAPLATPAQSPPAMEQGLAQVLVHRDPSCGCCEKWVGHMQQAGFTVELRDEADMRSIKEQLGIPGDKASCHTAEIDGYVFEGHVPAEDIKRFLSEKPKARGLLVPGMPVGSPGMEVPGVKPHAYTVERLEADGSTTPFAQHGG